jgi:deoxycytidylate deaminase
LILFCFLSAIIQCGIQKIFVHEQFYKLSTKINREKWIGHDDITMQMFDEANVELVMLNLPNLKVEGYLDGLVYHFGC